MERDVWRAGDAGRVATVRGYRRIEELVPAQWVEGELEANGIRQHYFRTGGEKPALVLLHGFMESGLCWLRTARALQGEYDVVMPDARGHGRSEGIASGFSTELLVEDAAALMHGLGLERPSLLGSSMGGGTAARVAAAYPELARAVLLEDAPWRRAPGIAPTASEGYNAWAGGYLEWLANLKMMSHEERLASALAYVPMGAEGVWPEEELAPFVEALAQVDAELAERSLTFWSDPALDGSVGEVVPQIRERVLLMQATHGVAGADAGGSLFMNADVSALSRVTAVGFTTSHLIRREAFERFLEVVGAFLRGEEVVGEIGGAEG